MEAKRIKVILGDEALEFFNALPLNAQKKITYNINRLESGSKDKELFKKLTNTNIWELRTLLNNICYRFFAFWDTEKETLIIATHGIIKKTQKTPINEIEKAERMRKEYFEQKQK